MFPLAFNAVRVDLDAFSRYCVDVRLLECVFMLHTVVFIVVAVQWNIGNTPICLYSGDGGLMTLYKG